GIHRHKLSLARSGSNYPRKLVTQDEWLLQLRIPDSGFGEPVEVRSADPHRLHPHQHLTRPRLRHRLIERFETSSAGQPDCKHRCRLFLFLDYWARPLYSLLSTLYSLLSTLHAKRQAPRTTAPPVSA